MYFGTFDGRRTGFIVFDMPPFAEPFFMGVNAYVQFIPVMNAYDLRKGLAKLC